MCLLSLSMLLLASCVGDVGDVEMQVDRSDEGPSRDAGRADARAQRDARNVERDDEEEDEEDEDRALEEDDTDEARPSVRGGDAGRDASRDARSAEDDEATENEDEDEETDDEETDDDTSRDGGVDAGPSSGDSECPNGRAPATGLRIREVALYQTIKVGLYANGSWVSQRTSPVVAGKKSLVRVFVETTSGYSPHAVRGSLVLENGGSSTELVDERTVRSSSTDQDADSTFTFQVEGSEIKTDTKLRIAIEEPACASSSSSSAQGTRLPETGTQELSATSIAKLRVVVVPVSVNGRLPPTGPSDLAAMKAMLLAYFPVPDVDLSVRSEPVTVSGSIAGSDNRAWTNLLNQIMRTRANDRVESDVYYYGLMQPADTQRTYCARGCILGIAPLATRVSSGSQIGLGASFGNAQSYETMVHELGHAHGRGHAPCAQGGRIQGVDSRFPESSGVTAVWGWDSRSDKLLPPTHRDVMGYCQPNWISAYTYNALAERSQQVNKSFFVLKGASAQRWEQILLYADGDARWSGVSDTEEPGAELEPAQVFDVNGNFVADIEVARMPLADIDDEILYLPEPGPRWWRVVLRDRVVDLADVAAPL